MLWVLFGQLGFGNSEYEYPKILKGIRFETDTVKPKKQRLADSSKQIRKVVIKGEKENDHFLPSVDGANIYAGKKSELIVLDSLTVNAAANTARQIFAKVPGLNIWESDGAGLQLGIGGRGLSPNRVSNFNTRQNGYDISADALGYPESYYTPPAEIIEKIEILRGASSLQYGTQFGGLINFKLKTGVADKKIQLSSAQTLGSYGFLNHTSSIGGTVKNINYFGLYQYKKADGWRANSGFQSQTVFANVAYTYKEVLKVKVDYTHLSYLAQQAGGLTDNQFADNPRASFRNRNWFQINWNILSLTADYRINNTTKLNWRNFALFAGREALGNLEPVNRTDALQNRDLLKDKYANFGSELRLIKQFSLANKKHIFLSGLRFYRGNTMRQQGEADDTQEPNFRYLNPQNLEGSDFNFPSQNLAWFAESIFNINDQWSIIPGIRVENIITEAKGTYRQIFKDLAGNIIFDETIQEQKIANRSFVIAGLGTSYKTKKDQELYLNFSQNYRAVNFNDLRVINPSLRVDPNLQDERGFTSDIGFRGVVKRVLRYDVSAFWLKYNNRIGSILQVDTQSFNIYRLRTNIAASNSYGIEFYGEIDLVAGLKLNSKALKLNWFINTSAINARYANSKVRAIEGNLVELVPNYIVRSGISWGYNKWKGNLQHSYTSRQFTEATNTEITSTGIDGIIPAYQVGDLNLAYQMGRFTIQFAVNNLYNEMFFTRRAAGYPGPGILPSDGRSFFLTLKVVI